jgi:hypothetical protein
VNPEDYGHTTSRKARDASEIQFLQDVPPESTYVILGTLSVSAPNVERTVEFTVDKLIRTMQEKASEIGADALINFRTVESLSTRTFGSIDPTYGGPTSAVHYKGARAWAEAIIFVGKDQKDRKMGPLP